MTWTRISDNFYDSVEVIGLSDEAFRTHVNALVWSNKQLKDGVIPKRAVRLLTASDDAALRIVSELVTSGLWSEDGESYLIDWSDQEASANVKERAQNNAERQRAFRERRAKHAAGDHSSCNRCSALHNGERNALRNALDNTLRNSPPSRPVPTPREGGGGDVVPDEMTPGSRSASPVVMSSEPATIEQLVTLRDLAIKVELEAQPPISDGYWSMSEGEAAERIAELQAVALAERLEGTGWENPGGVPWSVSRPDIWASLSDEGRTTTITI